MYKQLGMFGVLAVSGLAWMLAGGCAAPANHSAPETTRAASPAPTSSPAQESSAAELQRRRASLQRRLEIAALELAKARIAIELGQLKARDAVALADKEFELAKKRLQVFDKMTEPARRARAELSLQMAEDGVAEAQEDLYQLELKNSADAGADGPREVQIQRAKRRLERMQRDLELSHEEFRTLTEVLLPLEREELEFAAEQSKRAALQAQRDDEGPLLDRKIALMAAEAEVQELEEELNEFNGRRD